MFWNRYGKPSGQDLSLHTHPLSQTKETSAPSWRLEGRNTRPLRSWFGMALHDFTREKKRDSLHTKSQETVESPLNRAECLGTFTCWGCMAPGSKGCTLDQVSSNEIIARFTGIWHFLANRKEFLMFFIIITVVDVFRW